MRCSLLRLTTASVIGGTLLTGCGAQSLASTPSAAGAHRGSWSSPHAITSARAYASSPQAAVGGSGRLLVAWNGGTPPRITIGGPSIPQHSTAGSSAGLKVIAALGSLPGRIGRPAVLSRPGAVAVGAPKTAVAGTGVAYVVWPQTRRYVWMVAAAKGQRFSAPRPLGIPAGAQLQELASAGSGPVAAVWLQYHVHSAPAFRYALLNQSGKVGRTVTIAHLGSPLENVQFAINDHGTVVASWVNTGKLFGNRPRVSAERCNPAGHCTARQTVRFDHPIGQDVNVATTLSDNGTAVIVISGYRQGTPQHFETTRYGLQAAVSRGNAPFRSTPMISSTGENQAASAQGSGGAIAAFNVGGIPVRTLAWSRLANSAANFTRPQVLDHSEISVPVIASNPSGNTVLAWTDAPLGEITATSYSIHATTGTGGPLARPRTIAPGRDHIAEATLATAIDHRGDAIVIWNEWANSQPHGVFASTYTP